MEYAKPTLARMNLGVEHCMCGGGGGIPAIAAIDLGT